MKTDIKKTMLFGLGLLLTGMHVLASKAMAQQVATPDTTVVKVLGTAEDARFEPAELQVNSGDIIRFEIREGLHTVTAYHPDNRRPLRIPAEAEPFDSGPLQADSTWFLQLRKVGTYNYFCLPHERFGHVGRITVKDLEVSSKGKAEKSPFSLTTTTSSDIKEN